jgi:hypothetical protein
VSPFSSKGSKPMEGDVEEKKCLSQTFDIDLARTFEGFIRFDVLNHPEWLSDKMGLITTSGPALWQVTVVTGRFIASVDSAKCPLQPSDWYGRFSLRCLRIIASTKWRFLAPQIQAPKPHHRSHILSSIFIESSSVSHPSNQNGI